MNKLYRIKTFIQLHNLTSAFRYSVYWVIWVTKWNQEHLLIWGFTQQRFPDNPVNLLLIYFYNICFFVWIAFLGHYLSAQFLRKTILLSWRSLTTYIISNFSWWMLCYVKAREHGNVSRKKKAKQTSSTHSLIYFKLELPLRLNRQTAELLPDKRSTNKMMYNGCLHF